MVGLIIILNGRLVRSILIIFAECGLWHVPISSRCCCCECSALVLKIVSENRVAKVVRKVDLVAVLWWWLLLQYKVPWGGDVGAYMMSWHTSALLTILRRRHRAASPEGRTGNKLLLFFVLLLVLFSVLIITYQIATKLFQTMSSVYFLQVPNTTDISSFALFSFYLGFTLCSRLSTRVQKNEQQVRPFLKNK